MPEEFEDRDLSEAVFWGVRLRGAAFRDADLSGARFFHTLWSDVSIDGVIDRLVVNGVDVTDYVNERDRWFPLRNRLEPTTGADMRAVWSELSAEWRALHERADALDPSCASRSVNGEWSLRDTLRHLIFAIDKWFAWPILGARSFSPNGLPNSGSQGGDWPGLVLASDPDYADVRAEHAVRAQQIAEYLESTDPASLPATVDVPENGTVPTLMCFHAVFEEHFEHLRYALRDLDAIARG